MLVKFFSQVGYNILLECDLLVFYRDLPLELSNLSMGSFEVFGDPLF